MPDDEDEVNGLALAYAATRAILRARDAEAAQSALVDLCRGLGAEVVAAEDDVPGSLPIDMTVGDGDPLLPASEDPRVRTDLRKYLVPAISDARDVVERGLSSERLVKRATRDPLTGLWSRRSLTIAINRLGVGDCLALLDLDHFKSINDNFGHAAGDAVLAGFGTFLKEGVRDHDIAGRLGGEEFVVIFPQTAVDQAVVVLERLRSTWPAAAPQRSTFSTGVAQVQVTTEGGEVAGQIALQVADELMYQAKSGGRDKVVSAS